jgi:hypothetical protein
LHSSLMNGSIFSEVSMLYPSCSKLCRGVVTR